MKSQKNIMKKHINKSNPNVKEVSHPKNEVKIKESIISLSFHFHLILTIQIKDLNPLFPLFIYSPNKTKEKNSPQNHLFC